MQEDLGSPRALAEQETDQNQTDEKAQSEHPEPLREVDVNPRGSITQSKELERCLLSTGRSFVRQSPFLRQGNQQKLTTNHRARNRTTPAEKGSGTTRTFGK